MRISFMTIIVLLFSSQLFAVQTNRVYLNTCKTHGTKQDTRIFTRCVKNNFITLERAISDIYLNTCPIAYSMRQSVENCHNSNFTKLSYELQLNLRQCQNFGNEVTVSYEYCINRNFRNIEYNLNNR